MPPWKHAALPVYLAAAETERVLTGALDGGPQELRNHAILLMLKRMGLRACEVIQLTLDEINWAEGYISVGPGKTHRERRLPLPQDVGTALYAYLQRARPHSSLRTVFLGATILHAQLQDSSAISKIVRRAMARSFVLGISSAAHALRHTAATQMVCRGASSKEVADVLPWCLRSCCVKNVNWKPRIAPPVPPTSGIVVFRCRTFRHSPRPGGRGLARIPIRKNRRPTQCDTLLCPHASDPALRSPGSSGNARLPARYHGARRIRALYR
jgi:hypothetical protein